jgi:hypothetical protein
MSKVCEKGIRIKKEETNETSEISETNETSETNKINGRTNMWMRRLCI